AKVSWDDLVAESVAFGSPDTVAARIQEFQRLGVGEMLCWINFGGLPQERVRRSMELFAREVMPRFRSIPSLLRPAQHQSNRLREGSDRKRFLEQRAELGRVDRRAVAEIARHIEHVDLRP